MNVNGRLAAAIPSPNGAKSYSPGRSAAQAWVRRPQTTIAPTGRNNLDGRSSSSGVEEPHCDRVALSGLFQLILSVPDPGLRKASALGYRIWPIQGQKTTPRLCHPNEVAR